MDVRYQIVIYALIAVTAALVVVLALHHKRTTEYDGGRKLSATEYLNKLPYYKKKMQIYNIIVAGVAACGLIAFVCAGILLSRPYKEQIHMEKQSSRDIILCVDISTSVDDLNMNLCAELKHTVEQLRGDRFGLVIFNTSSVILCPLTDDYEYVIDELDHVERALRTRLKSNYTYDDYDDLIYLQSGTLIGAEDRGSSLIADGLASTVFDFTYSEEEEERSRFIIFSTDNDPYGQSYVTLQEAADMCTARDIVVYGIGTEEMTSYAKDEMQAAVESTGGLFFLEEESGSIDAIVNRINASQRTLMDGDVYVTKIDDFAKFFKLLLVAVIAFYGLRRYIKR